MVTSFRSKSFSIQKYGAEQAFKLAVAAREAFEAALI
ncbi:AP2/ERF family transcription factor [Rouxiella aceris]